VLESEITRLQSGILSVHSALPPREEIACRPAWPLTQGYLHGNDVREHGCERGTETGHPGGTRSGGRLYPCRRSRGAVITALPDLIPTG
jgi:hypothetical protein